MSHCLFDRKYGEDMENRKNNMGTLHLLAACFVMYGHHCALIGKNTPIILGSFIQALGVKVIFIISGYLITRSLYKDPDRKGKNIFAFFVKRIGRIWPELVVCLAFSAFIIGPIFTDLSIREYFGSSSILIYVIYNAGLFITYALPGLFANNPYPHTVNGALWTIPVEIMLYIIVLLIYIVARNNIHRKRLFCIVTLVIIASFLCRLLWFPTARIVIYATDWIQALNIMPYFMIGGMAYIYDIKKYLNIQMASILIFVFGSLYFSIGIINEFFCLLILPYFILSLSLNEKQNLKGKWMHSEYAYGMYLYGFVIQQCIIQKLHVELAQPINEKVIFFLSLICTYFVAMLSNKYVYRPIYMGIEKIIRRVSDL